MPHVWACAAIRVYTSGSRAMRRRCWARTANTASRVWSQWSSRLCVSQKSAISSSVRALEMLVCEVSSDSFISSTLLLIHVSRTYDERHGCKHLCTPPTCPIAGGWCPAFEVFAREPALLELAVQEKLEEVSHAFMIVRVDVIVPLLEPRDEFGNTGEQRRQALHCPALLFHHLSVPGCQGSGLLQMVPASPGNHESRV